MLALLPYAVLSLLIQPIYIGKPDVILPLRVIVEPLGFVYTLFTNLILIFDVFVIPELYTVEPYLNSVPLLLSTDIVSMRKKFYVSPVPPEESLPRTPNKL